MIMDEKEIARDLTIAAFEKVVETNRKGDYLATVIAEMYKTIYETVHSVTND